MLALALILIYELSRYSLDKVTATQALLSIGVSALAEVSSRKIRESICRGPSLELISSAIVREIFQSDTQIASIEIWTERDRSRVTIQFFESQK